MSTYSHYPQYYQQPPVYPSGYASSALQFQQQQHELAIASDPNAFRQFYASRLAALTINSRPIIQDLSLIAMNHAHRMSQVVVQCIEAHIRAIAPEFKLPAFYLLDSIAKNVFHPYAGHFAPSVASLFLEAYHQADGPNRSKMEEMLVTWRTGAPGGRELFGIGPQVAIERSVWGTGGTSGSDAAPARPPNKSQVLTELEVTLAQKERAVKLNPYDTVSSGHIDVLIQLRTLVQTSTVSPEELSAILTQLRNLARSTASGMPPPPAPPTQSQPVFVPPLQPYGAPTPILQPGYPTYPQSQPTYPFGPASSSTFPTAAAMPSSAPSAVPNLTDLYSSLVKAGLLSAPVGNNSGSADIKASNIMVDPEAEAMKEYERNLLRMKIRLNSQDIVKQRPQIIPLLYEHLPLQCKQCAIRFPEANDGTKRMEDHLDMHFRQNRKANLNIGRGHSRSWFVGVDNWMHDIPESGSGKGKGRQDGLSSSKAAAAAAAEKLSQLRNSFVVVPPGEEAKVMICPVCKEPLKPEFLEEDEDWVWKNAIQVQGKIYHATCHEEISNASSVAARLRHESTLRSRSRTPEVAPGRLAIPLSPVRKLEAKTGSPKPAPTPKLTGTKRTANDVEAEEQVESLIVKQEDNEDAISSPPRKKIALSEV